MIVPILAALGAVASTTTTILATRRRQRREGATPRARKRAMPPGQVQPKGIAAGEPTRGTRPNIGDTPLDVSSTTVEARQMPDARRKYFEQDVPIIPRAETA